MVKEFIKILLTREVFY